MTNLNCGEQGPGDLSVLDHLKVRKWTRFRVREYSKIVEEEAFCPLEHGRSKQGEGHDGIGGKRSALCAS